MASKKTSKKKTSKVAVAIDAELSGPTKKQPPRKKKAAPPTEEVTGFLEGAGTKGAVGVQPDGSIVSKDGRVYVGGKGRPPLWIYDEGYVRANKAKPTKPVSEAKPTKPEVKATTNGNGRRAVSGDTKELSSGQLEKVLLQVWTERVKLDEATNKRAEALAQAEARYNVAKERYERALALVPRV